MASHKPRSISTAHPTAQLALGDSDEQPTDASERPGPRGEEGTSTPTSDEVIEISRAELMRLATTLRSAAEMIDALVKRRHRRELDPNGEPTFAYAAKVVIPKDFYLTKRLTEYALRKGFGLEQVQNMLAAFVRYYAKSGRKWQDWSRVWMDWVTREAGRTTSGRMQQWR